MNQIAEAIPRTSPLGNQLIVDFYDCKCAHFDDVEWVENVMIEAANCAGANIVEVVFHKFKPRGISGVVVIAESHLAIHTWPEYRYAAIDIFTCGDMLDSEAAIAHLATRFHSQKRSVTRVDRGRSSELMGYPPTGMDNGPAQERLLAANILSQKKYNIEF